MTTTVTGKDFSGDNRQFSVSGYWHTDLVSCLVQSGSATAGSVSIGMGDHISRSISGDSPLDETLNQSPWGFSLEATV